MIERQNWMRHPILPSSAAKLIPWKKARTSIIECAGRDFLAASRGDDFAWFGPHERQATEILCRFIDARSAMLRVRRAEALARAVGVISLNDVVTDAVIEAEHRCGPRQRHRADIYARVVTNTRKLVIVIEAKFDHRARNPWRSYESLGETSSGWHGFILAPSKTAEIRNVISKRRKEWNFLSWRKFLRELERHLGELDDDDFRRFRATLLRRSERIAS